MRFTGKIAQLFLFLFMLHAMRALAEDHGKIILVEYQSITTGAMQTSMYFPLLKGKKVGVVTNQSGMIGNVHLVDSLMNSAIRVQKVFSPEHGFRGSEDAGQLIDNQTDSRTNLPVISLYGKNKKPLPSHLEGIDVMLFDLQDVGVRFYTYISTLTYVMEACAENGIPLIVLDRPNPNGFYIDGPVLDISQQSFVGLHPVPVVYGLTIGEYALMVKGENWINQASDLQLTVVKLKGYQRNMIVKLPVKPSPNLPNWQAVYLYPSLCFFEGTIVSVGRGTDFPFQQYGHPDLRDGNTTFTPVAMRGASNPPLKDKLCNGVRLESYAKGFENNQKLLQLKWLTNAYSQLKTNHAFFNNYFNTLAGTQELRKQIESGLSIPLIRQSWQDDINAYKKIRINYLLYPDPEWFK